MNPDDFYFYVFLKFVKKFREAQEAARYLGVSNSLMSRMMSGERPISKAVAVKLGYRIETVYVPKGRRA